jgi:hypothetical protein
MQWGICNVVVAMTSAFGIQVADSLIGTDPTDEPINFQIARSRSQWQMDLGST